MTSIRRLKKGPGAATAVGQAAKVHGTTRSRLEYPSGSLRSRRFSNGRDELGDRLQTYRKDGTVG
jgi:hypothetical protein